jgi:DNA modification methylase
MQPSLFDLEETTVKDIISPQSYTGIYSFHKYWGKKPIESILYFIQNYTNEGDIILDPFLGSGFICNESLKKDRRFIGIDVNPFSIEHSTFLLNLPDPNEYSEAVKGLRNKVATAINDSYRLHDNNIASHYLWEKDKLVKIWLKNNNGNRRIEIDPSEFDTKLISTFDDYQLKYIRPMNFFTNSRINSNSSMTIKDIFSNRALRNIEMLIGEIRKYPENLQRALLLTLTSSSGQMSNMVFAITNRGKTKNLQSEKIEVGSWVIGFWRPPLHFEINVWNCFERKAKKLLNAIKEKDRKNYPIFDSINDLMINEHGCILENNNCLDIMKSIPDNSIQLICTDPPHGDRIPYLELSEIWNAILGKEVFFPSEIIVSNAKERNKNKEYYFKDMSSFINECNRILKNDGVFILYFNARDKESWKFMKILNASTDLEFYGAFPMEYSAKSVVQENRNGSLKQDYILVMRHRYAKTLNTDFFYKIPGWQSELPVSEMEIVYGK